MIETQINEFLKSKNLADNTQKYYRTYLSIFDNHVNKPLQNLTEKDIIDFLAYIKNNPTGVKRGSSIRRYSDNSIKIIFAAIQSFLNYYDMERLCKKIPKKMNLKSSETLPDCLTEDKITRIINGIRDDTGKCIVSLLASSGLRIGELLSLKTGDIDMNENTITVRRSKTRRVRRTIFDKKTKYLLREVIGGRSKGYLFSTKLTPIMIYLRLKKWAAVANITDRVSAHVFRHSFATNMMRRGVSLKLIQELLGHSNIKTTSRYLSVASKEIEELGRKHPFDTKSDL